MSYYSTCPHCGAHLDPGESCSCIEARYNRLTPENKAKYCKMLDRLLKEQETPAGVRSTGGGVVEQNLTAVSTSYSTKN